MRGLRALGGSEVGLAWQDGKPVSATVRSVTGGPVTVRYGEHRITLNLRAGEEARLNSSLVGLP